VTRVTLAAKKWQRRRYRNFRDKRGRPRLAREFGCVDVEVEVAQHLDAIHKELRSELTMPDGRVIEVERNATPGAGFVLIYGEITDLKRSEPAIRAARDVAEAACPDLKAAQATLSRPRRWPHCAS
jgi:hypothetical protein